MASSSTPRMMMSSYSNEMPPRLLKDFLSDDSGLPSCSSHGFKSSLRRTDSHPRLLRNHSVSISAIHKASEAFVKAIKFIPFGSISRKKSKRDDGGKNTEGQETSKAAPKIKDILRWKSFRDVVEELSTSWLESDFTAEDLDSLDDCSHHQDCYYSLADPKNNQVEGGQQFCCDNQNGQLSPLSVLNDSPFREDDEHEVSASFFDRTIATMERRKHVLMQRIVEFEALAQPDTLTQEGEEGLLLLFTHEKNSMTKGGGEGGTNGEVEAKARELLGKVKNHNSETGAENDDVVLLDFFRHRLANLDANDKPKKDAELYESETMRSAKPWISRGCCKGTFDCELLESREACLREMDQEDGLMRWNSKNNFGEEQGDLGRELEILVLNDLLDELCNSVKDAWN